MSDESKPELETKWGPTNPAPSPRATLEKLTKLAVRAGRKRAREARERAKGSAKKK
jgi:hypothetical protein